MSEQKPYIQDDGEVRELGPAFFKNARRGRPPLPPQARKVRSNVTVDPELLVLAKERGLILSAVLERALRAELKL